MPEFVLLWTDALIFLLLAIVLVTVWITLRHEHLRAPWRQVAKSKTALSSLVVLSVYVLIGVLDTVHFHPRLEGSDGESQYSSEVVSLFDEFVEPLRLRQEKTYSAPLALYQFSKENIEQASGEMVRGYPRLKFAGAHLENPEQDWLSDMLSTSMTGLLQGAVLWGLTLLLMVWLVSLGQRTSFRALLPRLFQDDGEIPWHAAMWTWLVVCLLFGLLVALSAKYHVLGTDKVGEDVLYQALKSIRTGLVIGTVTTLVMLPAALFLGIMAGYFKGWVDDVIQYLYTTLNSIPSVLLIASAVLMMHIYMSNHADDFNSLTERADLRLLFLCVILGVTSWTGLCRLLRGETFKLRELDYVQSARALGVGHFTILHRHILPNVLHIVLISVVLDFSGLVLAEAVLSYINIGVDPSTDSWGNMINSARLELAREPVVWWSLMAAFFFMFVLVLAANLLADVVRDAFDPRLRAS